MPERSALQACASRLPGLVLLYQLEPEPKLPSFSTTRGCSSTPRQPGVKYPSRLQPVGRHRELTSVERAIRWDRGGNVFQMSVWLAAIWS